METIRNGTAVEEEIPKDMKKEECQKIRDQFKIFLSYKGELSQAIHGENDDVSKFSNMLKVISKNINVKILQLLKNDWT